ncbi:MAG: choice-of-anchor D domain-containing protein [Actinomycetota bacterium]
MTKTWFRVLAAAIIAGVILPGGPVIASYSHGGGPNGPPPPVMSANPSGLYFKTATPGSATQELSMTITNGGPGDATITDPFFFGTNDFSISADACLNNTLKPNHSCVITVAFKPQTLGYQDTELQFPIQQSFPFDVQVSGDVVRPVQFDPASVDFGSVAVDRSTHDAGVFVQNWDSKTLLIHSVVISDPSEFVIARDLCTGASVGAGQSCEIDLEFIPTTTGSKSAALVVTSSSTASPDTLALSGTGTPRLVVASPGEVGFNNVVVSTTSPSQTVTVTNNDSNPVGIGQVSPDSSELTVTNDQCSYHAVPANGSCTFGVQFTPASIHTLRAVISIPDYSDYRPLQLNVYGMGTTSVLDAFPPGYVDFGSVRVGTTSSQMFRVINDGFSTFNFVESQTVSGGSTEPVLSPDNCYSIAPGQECWMTLQVTPQSAGVISGSIAIIGDSQSGTLDLPFSVDAIAPQISAPSSLNFPVQRARSTPARKTVTVSNAGSASMNVQSVYLDGDSPFSIDGNNCVGGPIDPGASCTIQISFAPLRSGQFDVGLYVVSDGGVAIVDVYGTGDGNPPVVNLDSSKTLLSRTLGDQLHGIATDDISGVAQVVVTYQSPPAAITLLTQSFTASLQCSEPTRCTWTAPLPSQPGLWSASVTGIDNVGNIDPQPTTGSFIII